MGCWVKDGGWKHYLWLQSVKNHQRSLWQAADGAASHKVKTHFPVNEPRRDTSHLASHHSTRSIVISLILMQIASQVSFEWWSVSL